MLTERCRNPDGGVTLTQLRVRVVLAAIFADMPERQYLARWPGAKAQLPCGYCRIQGTLCGRQYLPQGYASPVLHDLAFDPARNLHANAHELWVTDKCAHMWPALRDEKCRQWLGCMDLLECCRPVHARAHRHRGKLVDDGYEAALLGCRGSCTIATRLPYVSLGTLFPLPVAHMLLLGLQKGFWTLALTTISKGQERPLYVLSHRARRELTLRCAQLRATSDFGRTCRCGMLAAMLVSRGLHGPQLRAACKDAAWHMHMMTIAKWLPGRDIVALHRLFTMEELAQVADCFGRYITRDGLLGPVLGPIWRLLSATTTFVLRAGAQLDMHLLSLQPRQHLVIARMRTCQAGACIMLRAHHLQALRMLDHIACCKPSADMVEGSFTSAMPAVAAPGRPDHPYNAATLDAFEEQMWKLAVRVQQVRASLACKTHA